MPKKVTMQQRLMEFGLSAEPKEVENAIDTLKACLNARSPKSAAKPRKRKATSKGNNNMPPPPDGSQS